MKNIEKAYLYLLLSVLSLTVFYLGMDYVFRKYPDISVLNIVFWAWIGSNILVFPFFASTYSSREKIRKEFTDHWKLLLGVSLITTLGGFLWFISLSESNSGVISLLEKVNILFVAILGVFFLGEKISKKEILFMGITAIGIFLVANLQGEISSFAVFALLFSRLTYAVQSFFVKKYGSKTNSLYFSYIRGVLMSFFLAIMAIFLGLVSIIPIHIIVFVSVVQVFMTFISKAFFFEAHKSLDISKLNFFILFETVFVLIGSYFLFGDTVSIEKLIGAIFVFSGLILFLREQSVVRLGEKEKKI